MSERWGAQLRHFMHQPLIGPMIAHPAVHRSLLIACIGQVVLAWNNLTLIECPVPRLFHIPCPGCGLTRGVVATLHGDLLAGVRFHAFAVPALLVALLFLIATSLPAAWRQSLAGRVEMFERATCISAITIIAIYLYWMARILYVS